MNDQSTIQETAELAALLESRLMEWEKARKPQEVKLLECYQDVMRVPREDDTKGTATAKSKKANSLFIGSTRNKVRAARAKITDALFGGGSMPFDTSPVNEDLREFADVVEDIITDQMERGDFKGILKAGVNTLATYGTGFIFGPFVRKETLTETYAEKAGPSVVIQEREYEFDLPYFDLASTLDVYPDPEARDIDAGLGVFWVTMESAHTVKAWAKDPAYKNIDQACIGGSSDNGNETGAEIAKQLRGNVDYWFKNERIKVARYFGKIPSRLLTAPDEGDSDGDESQDGGELVDVIAIVAGGVVVKVTESPYSKSPAMRGLYEAVEHEMWGVGVAENNAPHQKVTNAAFRLFMEGKGMALLGTSSVDRSAFMPTEDFKKFPGKVYQLKPGLSPEQKQQAITHHIEPDITGGWIDVIRMSEQFSDDDTGITKYTQGDDSRNLNKTATGISMIMSASSLPFKEVISNIDGMWVEEMVERYIDWNLKYLEPETVQKIHGDKHAEVWAQIKEFGKSSFMEWKATGTSSFMQKEVLTNKIRGFSEFALSNPATASMIDARELLNQTWDVMEIGRESPILKEEGDIEIPPQIKQQMEQMQQQVQQLDSVIQGMTADMEKADEQARAAQLKLEQETSKRLKLEIQLDRNSAVEEIKAAQRDFSAQLAQPAPEAESPLDPQELSEVKQTVQMIAETLAQLMAQQTEQQSAMNAQLIEAVQGSADQTQQSIQDMTQAILAERMQPKTVRLPSGKVMEINPASGEVNQIQ